MLQERKQLLFINGMTDAAVVAAAVIATSVAVVSFLVAIVFCCWHQLNKTLF